MVTYEFYEKEYLGYLINQGDFPRMLRRAEQWLEKIERCCRVVPYGPDSRDMALCAIAETMAAWYKKKDVEQASVGEVTVRYQKNDIPLQRQLLQNVSGYLEIYRGVGS
jgi:hypothetical protein